MEHWAPRLLAEIASLVSIDLYSVAGVLEGDRLLVSALREGQRNVYILEDGRLTRANKEPVYSVARAPYGARTILVTRDVSRGREQQLIYRIRVDRPGVEERLPGVEPARILGLVYDLENRVVYSMSTETRHAIMLHTGDKPRLVAEVPGIVSPTDMKYPLVAGVGAFRPETGKFGLFTLNLETGELRTFEPPEGSVLQAVIAPDGRVVYPLTGARGAELRYLDPETGETGKLELPHRDLEEYRPMDFNYVGFTSDGRLVAVARREGRSRIFLEGRHVRAPQGIHGLVFNLGDGRLVTTHTSLSTPPRVIKLDPETGRVETLLEGDVPAGVREALAGSRLVWVESFDGSRVPTYVLESGRAPKPGPTVVLVHGGPFAEDADYWDIFAAALALAGFHVVMPNYRGSLGYGEEWRLRIIGDPCGGELEDIVAAGRHAVEEGLASRLYIMGYSYGGYMTMCALTRKPGVFRAGVAGASVVDWEEMYELSDAVFRAFIQMMFGGAGREKWRERSPITYAENLREPLCIVHPQNDSRTPLRPVLRFMMKLLEHGKTFEAHIAPDMGHAINTVEDVLKILWPAVEFLVRQEKGGRG